MKKISILLLLVVALAPSLAAQFVVTGLIGEDYPIILDTNGNGVPDPGDNTVWPERASPTDTNVVLAGDLFAGTTFLLQNFNAGTGKYEGASYNLTDVLISGFNGTTPTTFALTENVATVNSGQGQLVDRTSDGIWDGMDFTGDVNLQLDFLRLDTTGDGFTDYISFPWAQMTALGVNPDDGPAPQAWIPLADSNGDGRPDSIGADFFNDGVQDPDLHLATGFGPIIAANASHPIPTTSEWMLLLVTLSLAGAGVLHLRKFTAA